MATASIPSRRSGRSPDGIGARSTGLRLGALFGPAVFGVTAAGVALPEVARALGSTSSSATWVLTAHALALGIGTAVFGRLAAVWGVQTVLRWGSLLLTLGVVTIFLAPDLGTLVAGRLVLAAGSGALTAGALALLGGVVPDHRPAVLAVHGSILAVFAAAATLTGGVVTELGSWRVALALPALAVLSVPACLRLSAAQRRTGGGRVDVLGASALAITVSALLMTIQAPALGLPLVAVVLLAGVFVLGFAASAWRTARRPEGFLPRAVISDRSFLRALAVGSGVYAGLFAAMYAVPQELVAQHGFTVVGVGVALLPGAVLGALLSRAAGRIVARFGGGPLLALLGVAAGAVFVAAGLIDGGPTLPVLGVTLCLAAFACAQVVLTALVSNRLDPARRGAALSLLNLGFFVGGAAGSAIAGAVAVYLGLDMVPLVVGLLPLVAGLAALGLRRAD